ncbi:MAG: hypothetical protein KAQ62_02185 [Cyclobacteriaceae bacterium]|nr:hypothetical protein [Cyclobacteriaceae bacterium]MCK5276971.1 hypothetical protein [Cyclobacteriaceae bacterium]MCK5367321.1 hypothetical protein [Cyclobacteriaceae bacterium]MCK5467229.1 hypothetical protein [Cyclobacteriaceae bacterium]
MATIIKFTVDGISDEMIVPSVNFGLNSFADVTNPTQEIDFQPISVSEFSFSILSPKAETSKALLEWITNHDVKGQAKFSISKQAMTESAREIILKDVCLTSYSESIDENFTSTDLSIVGRKVSIGDIEVDLSQSR